MEMLTREDLFQRPHVNILKASEIAGVTPRTIYNYVYQGKVEYVRTAGGQIRIFADTLLRRERA
jgi:predicted site-specific integrase-resolvase